MADKPPFRLAEGIYLEAAGVLLPWAALLKELAEKGNPEILEDNGAKSLIWRDEKCLCGLDAAVLTRLNRKGKMTEAELSTFLDGVDVDARENFLRVRTHLEKLLGPSHRETEAMGFPSCQWAFGRVSISLYLFDRFGEYCNLKVEHRAN